MVIGLAGVLVALMLVAVALGLGVFLNRAGPASFGLPAPWRAFAAKHGGFAGEGEVRFRFEGGRVSLFRADYKTRHAAKFHDLPPGEYTVLVRTLERKEPQYSGDAQLKTAALPVGTQSMISGPVARVFLPGLVVDPEILEAALSALGALEREG